MSVSEEFHQGHVTTPHELKEDFPVSQKLQSQIIENRETIKRLVRSEDYRLFVVVGPCSIHDTSAALEYAERLKVLADELSDSLVIAMRVYPEKPRTAVGWKGLVKDPYLNDSHAIGDGLRVVRNLLIDIASIGLPIATETLDPIVSLYFDDIISWYAVGARTVESQVHRELASGLPAAVGFKNATSGDIEVAVNAMKAAERPHSYIGVDSAGRISVGKTEGNINTHIVLRGGSAGPNYSCSIINNCEKQLDRVGFAQRIMIDLSHANSQKLPKNQLQVLDEISRQIIKGNRSIFGIMMESNLSWGAQKAGNGRSQLKYGVSVTDACIDWRSTELSLKILSEKIQSILPDRGVAPKVRFG